MQWQTPGTECSSPREGGENPRGCGRNPLAGGGDYLQRVLIRIPAGPRRDIREGRLACVEPKRMASDECCALGLDLPLWRTVRVSSGVQKGVRHFVARARILNVRT